jgi:hypothetical protein
MTRQQYPQRTWYVCDSCMQAVGWREVGDFADFEHVLCKECLRKNREAHDD